MSTLPLPPFDLPVTSEDRILASTLTGASTDAEITRAAQYIRQYVDAVTAKLRPNDMNTESVNELRSALKLSAGQGESCAVMTTQQAVRGVLLEVEQLDELNKKYFAELEEWRTGNKGRYAVPKLTEEQRNSSPVPVIPWRDYGNPRRG